MEKIRPVGSADIPAVCAICNHYILHTVHTFAMEPLTEAEMQEKMVQITEVYPFLVAEREGEVVGYAHFNLYRSRCAYNHVAETSIYIHPEHRGQGIGSRLYPVLLQQAPAHGITEVIAVIALPNQASEKLHQRLGFREVGVFTRMGFKLERWIDTAYWQLSL